MRLPICCYKYSFNVILHLNPLNIKIYPVISFYRTITPGKVLKSVMVFVIYYYNVTVSDDLYG
jgi:hypothetical protein